MVNYTDKCERDSSSQITPCVAIILDGFMPDKQHYSGRELKFYFIVLSLLMKDCKLCQ